MKTDISLLLAASKILSTNLASEAAITALLKLLDDVSGLSKARVLLPNKEKILEIQFSYSLTEKEIHRSKYMLGEGITGKVMSTGNIALIPDIRQEPRYLNKINESIALSNETIAYIAVPILKRQTPIGVLAVYRSHPDVNSLQDDLGVLQVIATMIQLVLQVDKLLREKTGSLKTENNVLRNALLQNTLNHDIIGNSPALKNAIKTAMQAANSQATVMLYGESGTGKEKFARMIHFSSPQKDQPFITVNCAAIPENLLESELFGHTKGSFTGAIQNKIGKFEAANNGTLFLDEIGDMSYDLQAKLLRALQEKSIQRVGSIQETKINVRVVTATHKNIKDAVSQGTFRLDLYYRLNVLPIELPPLRDRQGDIKLLSLFFLNRANQQHRKNILFSPEIVDHLSQYSWPGNIRQLENIIERIVILCETDVVDKKQVEYYLDEENNLLPETYRPQVPSGTNMFSRPYARVNNNERQHILETLQASGGNKTQTAYVLGMTTRQLYYRLEKLEIEL